MSAELGELDTAYYQPLIGKLKLIVQLGRLNI